MMDDYPSDRLVLVEEQTDGQSLFFIENVPDELEMDNDFLDAAEDAGFLHWRQSPDDGQVIFMRFENGDLSYRVTGENPRGGICAKLLRWTSR